MSFFLWKIGNTVQSEFNAAITMIIKVREGSTFYIRILLFCPPVGYFFIYPTTWISHQKTRLVTVHA